MSYKYFNILGTMSGTSLDGIDLSLVSTNGVILKRLNKNFFSPFSKTLKQDLTNFIAKYNEKKLCKNSLLLLNNQLTEEYINTISESNLINECDLIGFHGQTIFHNPLAKTSLQIGNAINISNYFKKQIVYDFRSNDLNCGGQGAPLAPIYHKSIIEELNLELPTVIINIGGIANISYWDGEDLIGFDCGPGNCLMDYIMNKHNLPFDKNGIIASKGNVNKNILSKFLSDNYFSKKYPKSLDKLYFHHYLDNKLIYSQNLSDLMATLSEFTVQSIIKAIKILPKNVKQVIFCGGGVANLFLMNKLKKKFKIVKKLETHNISTEFLEAELIAYLTARKVNNLPITFPNTTGVKYPIIGGKIFNPKENH